MQCLPHFHYVDKKFSSIQLLVNEKFIHQSSFKLIKTFFISLASIYATLFIKGGREKSGGKVRGESPRPELQIHAMVKRMGFIHSLIPDISIAPQQVHYYSGALLTTALILYKSQHAEEQRVKDLSKVPTWRLEWDSNLRPSRGKAPNLPLSHHTHIGLRLGLA